VITRALGCAGAPRVMLWTDCPTRSRYFLRRTTSTCRSALLHEDRGKSIPIPSGTTDFACIHLIPLSAQSVVDVSNVPSPRSQARPKQGLSFRMPPGSAPNQFIVFSHASTLGGCFKAYSRAWILTRTHYTMTATPRHCRGCPDAVKLNNHSS
jgi:hypothetical protein